MLHTVMAEYFHMIETPELWIKIPEENCQWSEDYLLKHFINIFQNLDGFLITQYQTNNYCQQINVILYLNESSN